jgi:hypothetical protein
MIAMAILMRKAREKPYRNFIDGKNASFALGQEAHEQFDRGQYSTGFSILESAWQKRPAEEEEKLAKRAAPVKMALYSVFRKKREDTRLDELLESAWRRAIRMELGVYLECEFGVDGMYVKMHGQQILFPGMRTDQFYKPTVRGVPFEEQVN